MSSQAYQGGDGPVGPPPKTSSGSASGSQGDLSPAWAKPDRGVVTSRESFSSWTTSQRCLRCGFVLAVHNDNDVTGLHQCTSNLDERGVFLVTWGKGGTWYAIAVPTYELRERDAPVPHATPDTAATLLERYASTPLNVETEAGVFEEVKPGSAVPGAFDALREVLSLHSWITYQHLPLVHCRECSREGAAAVEWPCPTRRAIVRKLRGA